MLTWLKNNNEFWFTVAFNLVVVGGGANTTGSNSRSHWDLEDFTTTSNAIALFKV